MIGENIRETHIKEIGDASARVNGGNDKGGRRWPSDDEIGRLQPSDDEVG
jgi:hypothetical protein